AQKTNVRRMLMPCPRNCGDGDGPTAATIRGNSIEVKTVYLSADARVAAGGRRVRIFGFVCLPAYTRAAAVGRRRTDGRREAVLHDVSQRPDQERWLVAGSVRRGGVARARDGRREDDPQAARGDDAATGRAAP